MQDRPDAINLLETIQALLLKEVMPEVQGNEFLSYKTLVSWNMLGVVSRELKYGEKYLNEELKRLSGYLNQDLPSLESTYIEKMKYAEDLNRKLSEKIRIEKLDNTDKISWEMVKQTLKEKLEISNPRFSTGNEIKE
ncbi:MAG: hypothetical protein H7A25_01885 [Leptospiraceae bacterium]|nr:hypothetical protein [Leptospiraceae bacterium]MCP5498626.1 hypothetical protein [Leptospiraceae bacterium]